MKNRSVLLETILITAVTLLGMWFIPVDKTLFALIPVAYLLIERCLRKRTWADLGFSSRTFGADLRANWVLFLGGVAAHAGIFAHRRGDDLPHIDPG